MTILKYPLPYYIRVALDLEPWDEFATKRTESNREYYGKYYNGVNPELYRGIGTTTRMLVQAVYFSQNREVYLKGYNQKYTELLVRKARQMTIKLGLDYSTIKPFPYFYAGRDFSNSYVYKDHYITEAYERREQSRDKLARGLHLGNPTLVYQ
jgi:hypothetical protein